MFIKKKLSQNFHIEKIYKILRPVTFNCGSTVENTVSVMPIPCLLQEFDFNSLPLNTTVVQGSVTYVNNVAIDLDFMSCSHVNLLQSYATVRK